MLMSWHKSWKILTRLPWRWSPLTTTPLELPSFDYSTLSLTAWTEQEDKWWDYVANKKRFSNMPSKWPFSKNNATYRKKQQNRCWRLLVWDLRKPLKMLLLLMVLPLLMELREDCWDGAADKERRTSEKAEWDAAAAGNALREEKKPEWMIK